MLQTQIIIESGEGRRGGMFQQFLESLKGVLLRPGAFFLRLPDDSSLGRPAIFLFACSGLYSVLAAPF
jgi:hypothetical protein